MTITLIEAAAQFTPPPGYLAACTAGLPTNDTVTALMFFTADWAGGRLDAAHLVDQAERCRELYAEIVGVPARQVAFGSQTSQLVSVIATGVPDGGEVLCVEGDFSSLTHPFEQLRGRGVTVRYAPLGELAEAVTERTSLVAYSMVQSATGEVADAAAIRAAARDHGALTLCDLTQPAGWLPADASLDDFTVCHAYKWLCAPRGTAFLTVRAGLEDSLTPLAAGWCSADDVWSSCYAGHTPLGAGANRFDVSHAWPALGGTEAALRLFAALDLAEVEAHNIDLANRARAMLGLAPGNSAIVTWRDPSSRDLQAMQKAGIVASGRAGNARITFHLWNTDRDVELLAEALGRDLV